jgi:hypothetical protein
MPVQDLKIIYAVFAGSVISEGDGKIVFILTPPFPTQNYYLTQHMEVEMPLPGGNMCMSDKLFLWWTISGLCWLDLLCLEFLEKMIKFILPSRIRLPWRGPKNVSQSNQETLPAEPFVLNDY